MEDRKIEFRADRVRVITFEGNEDDIRIQLYTGVYERQNIKELFDLPKGVLKITIEPIVE